MKNTMMLLRSLFVAYALLLTTSLADAKKNKNKDNDKPASTQLEDEDIPDYMEGHSLEDSFYLKPSAVLYKTSVDNGIVKDYDGTVTCLLSKAVRINLYSPFQFELSEDESFVTDKEGNTFNLNIWRGNCEDDLHTVDFTKSDDDKIIYINVASPHGDDTHYQAVEGETDVFYSYKDSMMLDEGDSNAQLLDDIRSTTIPSFLEVDDGDDEDHEKSYSSNKNVGNRFLKPKLTPSNGASLRGGNKDRQLADTCSKDNFNRCNCFKVITVQILYDAAFCSKYKGATISNIQDIVLQASKMYEEDTCVRINIGSIKNVDDDDKVCGDWDKNSDGKKDLFSSMPRDSLCSNGNNWISAFTEFMRTDGDDLKNESIQAGATHLFSGYPATSGAVGCAWIGGVCSGTYSYGIDLMDWTQNRRAQAAVFAHELGHNLGCQHVNVPNKVMYYSVGAETSGFSDVCKSDIDDTLSRKTCFSTEPNPLTYQAPPGPAPTPAPTPAPAPAPIWPKKSSLAGLGWANDPDMAWNKDP
mmetsp:Transcript_31726/g.48645  ORF Transcript_31726/g.48645 Transcript_31726/m.48645 type:complete len:526 (+) Transcript_31726:182-1759(+)|eukprot:CAMPEP_0195282178 /NCGR_PEP_ID=MMETSP0707-20130614/1167_1 /TAXON_ID=33640 /ORGANISM="Asterionellopsis glacialis, Strain CCMP134" /LENGTH=525 /DNA_ID=CAMNT_0040341131 /DNA_START=167 /DNA_END=1744 /DNA_ORIENTATION=-